MSITAKATAMLMEKLMEILMAKKSTLVRLMTSTLRAKRSTVAQPLTNFVAWQQDSIFGS